MRLFGMNIPDEEIPNGSFKRTMQGDNSLNLPPITQAEKDWIASVLESRKRQLLAGVPFDKLRYKL